MILSFLKITHKMKMSKRSESLDRLSELPDSLVLNILSLLPMRDVIMTTLLSKRFKDLWTTVPCLSFKSRVYVNDGDGDGGGGGGGGNMKILFEDIIGKAYKPTAMLRESLYLLGALRCVER